MRYRYSIPEAVALATADTREACAEGHFDCATTDGGPCSAEAAAELFARGLDVEAFDRYVVAIERGRTADR